MDRRAPAAAASFRCPAACAREAVPSPAGGAGGDDSRGRPAEHTPSRSKAWIIWLTYSVADLAQVIRQRCGGDSRHGFRRESSARVHLKLTALVLDLAFREDKARHRAKNTAQNMTTLRHFALNIIKSDPNRKLGVANTRKRAGWDRECLIKLLTNFKQRSGSCVSRAGCWAPKRGSSGRHALIHR